MTQELKPFKTIVFDDYAAQKNGNQVLVTKKDGTQQIMEMQDFKKFLIANVPQVKTKPAKDTFNFSSAFEAFPVNENDSVGTKIGKQLVNIGRLHVINKDDTALEKMNKGLHNFTACMWNPMANAANLCEMIKNPTDNKYSVWRK